MWNFDTHDNDQVALKLEVFLFDLLDDPAGEFALEPIPTERAYAAPAPRPEVTIRVSSSDFANVNSDVIEACDSRTVLRTIVAGLVYARQSEKDAVVREALHAYLMQATARLDTLVQRDGA